jgi:hypothetical protein
MPIDEEKKIWFEEAWEAWIRPLTIIACIGLLALAYVRDWIPQPWMGSLIAVIFLGIAFGVATFQSMNLAKGFFRPLLATIGLLGGLLLGIHLWFGLHPGEPSAIHEFSTGDNEIVEMETLANGRIEIEAIPLAGIQKDGTEISFQIHVTHFEKLRKLDGKFRLADTRPQRPGERSRVRSPHLRKTFAIEGIHENATARISSIQPEGKVRLIMRTFATPLPLSWGILLLGFLSFVTAFIEGKQPERHTRIYLTMSLLAAAFIIYLSPNGFPPSEAVQAMMGPMILSVIPSAVLGTMMPWFFRKWHNRNEVEEPLPEPTSPEESTASTSAEEENLI